MNNEANARIKINKMLENAGWRFIDNENGKANIIVELETKIIPRSDYGFALGDNFEKTEHGFADYILLDEFGKPFIVVEAKKESIQPLTAKEQARKYAISLRVKYIILTNGNLHYFWNLEKGNPELITTIPSYDSLKKSKALNNSTSILEKTEINKYYIALSQDPAIELSPFWKSRNEVELDNYCLINSLRVLREYQLAAIRSVQNSIKQGNTRFLLEMATGTGKTLTAAGLIKLFIRSELAHRVLFLVDRIELENQAKKDITKYLSKDGIRVDVYKENKSDWIAADVVISTIQSFSRDNKYQSIFTPSDFDLVISDEAHRSIGASNRAIFEYFLGYKLGLTATPKNYLKGVDFDIADPREIEKRMLLDTYSIFGCDSGTPTFSYTLNDGVKDGILINPKIIDARTDITTQLLSDKGLIIESTDDNVEFEFRNEDDTKTLIYSEKSYEKKFFSDSTNITLCKTFMDNAQKDPISGEIGKSIVFCVNIEHARKVTEILNALAYEYFGNMYSSDFAVQITSNVQDSQQMTINFANNNLNGNTKWLEDYFSSKTRVAVTVGMMTTGYDCPDILNLALFRPIFSPSEFIQIKGRGTRLNKFVYEDIIMNKEVFYLFDFFAVCEYFENDFKYDEQLKLPTRKGDKVSSTNDEGSIVEVVINKGLDSLYSIKEEKVQQLGMKIDRKFYQSFEEKMNNDPNVNRMIEEENSSGLEYYLKTEVFDKPTEFYNVKKLEQSLGLDRKLTIKEIVLKLLGKLQKYRTKNELLSDEFNNFILLNKKDLESYEDLYPHMESLFQAYLLDYEIRNAVRNKHLHILLNSQIGRDLRAVKEVRIHGQRFLDYLREYVIMNDINCEKFS